MRLKEGFEFDLEAVGVLGGQEGVDQIHRGDPTDRVSPMAGVRGERQGQMSFAQAHSTQKEDVAMLGQPVEMEEMLDLGAIDLFGPGPIEIVEGFHKGEPGGLEAAL